jgi:ribosomal protein S18 acetylase RimI-like enzyme
MPRATPTQAMYDYLLPLLQLKGISHHLLEVITHNEKAIHIYKIGFETYVHSIATKETLP